MKEIDLSIIIISFNTSKLTLECLQSIYRDTSGISFEIIVVDNASLDDSVKKISDFIKGKTNAKLIENDKNEGFSRANNIGIKASSGRFLLFLNSDTVVPEKTLSRMVDFMDKHKDAGAATCFVRMANNKLDDAAHRGFPTPWNALCHFSGVSKIFPNSRLFNGYHMGWCNLGSVHEIDALAGAFMLVRREAGEECGWWDEDYFFYGEDIDFCYTLKQKRWKIYFVPDAEILHLKGASSGIKKESQQITKASIETKKWVTNQRFDAMKIFYKKHYLKKYPFFITGIIMTAVEMKRRYTLRNIS